MVVMLSPWGLLAAIIEPQIYFYFYTLLAYLIKFYVLNYVLHFYETMGRLNWSPRCMFL